MDHYMYGPMQAWATIGRHGPLQTWALIFFYFSVLLQKNKCNFVTECNLLLLNVNYLIGHTELPYLCMGWLKAELAGYML